MKTLIIFLLLALPVSAQDNDWTFEVRPFAWFAFEGNTRVQSMEQEAVSKGGTGEGSRFRYSTLDHDDLLVIPELEFRAAQGPHRVHAGIFYSLSETSFTLDRDIEYDGDLLFVGDKGTIESELTFLYMGYAHRILTGSPEVAVGIDLMYYDYFFEFRRSSGNILFNDVSSGETWSGLSLPVFRVTATWTVCEDLQVETDLGFLYAIVFQSARGIADNSNGMIRFRTTVHWDLGPVRIQSGVGYHMLDAVTFEHRDEADLLNYRMMGLQLGISYPF